MQLLLFFGIFQLTMGQLRVGENPPIGVPTAKSDAHRYSQQGICSEDPFLSSPVYNNRKVFLFPWNQNERKGDWWHNLGYCNKYCAEMVTIQSDEENNYVHWWLRTFAGMTHPGAWLGAQIYNATKNFEWQNTERLLYNNPAPGEYNEGATSCLHLGWANDHNKWFNYHCNTNNIMIFCQRWVGAGDCNDCNKTT